MLWSVRRRDSREMDVLLADCRFDSLSYAPVGCSLDDVTPPSLTRHSWSRTLSGPESFDRVADCLRRWCVHRDSGLTVVTDGELAVGANVVMEAAMPVGHVIATCRVVRMIEERERFGFAYGTLHAHPERGEEAFIVSRTGRDESLFEITAVSSHAHPVARLAPPVATYLQRVATNRYLDAARAAARA